VSASNSSEPIVCTNGIVDQTVVSSSGVVMPSS
jgi:hypothetical protein